MGSKKEGASGNTAVVPAVATDEKSSTSETVAESIATDPPKEEASADAAEAEAVATLKALVESSGGTGLMHESFWYATLETTRAMHAHNSPSCMHVLDKGR